MCNVDLVPAIVAKSPTDCGKGVSQGGRAYVWAARQGHRERSEKLRRRVGDTNFYRLPSVCRTVWPCGGLNARYVCCHQLLADPSQGPQRPVRPGVPRPQLMLAARDRPSGARRGPAAGASEVDLTVAAPGEVHLLGDRRRDHRAHVHLHGDLLSPDLRLEQGRGPVEVEGLGLAVLAGEREVHLLVGAVEGRVVVAEEGHAQDPDRAVAGGHVDLHEGWHAHVQLADLRLEEEDVPDVAGLKGGAGHAHDVRLRGQRERLAVDHEGQRRQLVEVGAVLLDLRDHLAQLHQRVARGRDQGGAAVDDGGAAGLLRTRDLVRLALEVAEAHVVQRRDPVVLADDVGGHEIGLLHVLALGGSPGEVADGAAGLAEAHGEVRDAVGHQQRLLRVAVGEVRANANDGGELCRVQHRDVVLDDLPEGLALCAQGSHHDVLVAHHRDAGTRAEHMLGHGPVLDVGQTGGRVVRVGGMHAVVTSRGPHEQLERACVEDALDRLATKGEVAPVLHVLEVVQRLPIGADRVDILEVDDAGVADLRLAEAAEQGGALRRRQEAGGHGGRQGRHSRGHRATFSA
mmetsp:Transcript_4733/g.12893  ORF Transcript_4733/g.12893 Transcript_4733/m.12893 type:complete len:572 (+) Transcript_4733:343-2058(+)